MSRSQACFRDILSIRRAYPFTPFKARRSTIPCLLAGRQERSHKIRLVLSLAEEGPIPHLASSEEWRHSSRPYDENNGGVASNHRFQSSLYTKNSQRPRLSRVLHFPRQIVNISCTNTNLVSFAVWTLPTWLEHKPLQRGADFRLTF